jgi:hypothetical protein
MPKRPCTSKTCAAVSADISRKRQINTQSAGMPRPMRCLRLDLYLYEIQGSRQKRLLPQPLGKIFVSRLIRTRQLNTRGLR